MGAPEINENKQIPGMKSLPQPGHFTTEVSGIEGDPSLEMSWNRGGPPDVSGIEGDPPPEVSGIEGDPCMPQAALDLHKVKLKFVLSIHQCNYSALTDTRFG